MAIAASPPLLPIPSIPPSRVIALRPIAAGDAGARAGTGPQVEAEALREDELFRLRADPAEGRSPGAGSGWKSEADRAEDDDAGQHDGERPGFAGDTAAFVAQLFAADEPEAAFQDPLGDAAKAYGRFREERHTGIVIDVHDPIDVEA